MKKLFILAITAALVGCANPEVIYVTKRETAYVPYPSCPAPKIPEPLNLPIYKITDTTKANDVASMYVKSIAMLKAEVASLTSQLLFYKDLHAEYVEYEKSLKANNEKN